jgi:spore coat polysaccharide biosynthesis protein SpsF
VTIAVGIQARMSSTRFPGKVLAKLQGKPIIEHLSARFQKMGLPFFVLTSTNTSDDPLVEFLQDRGCEVYRGSLDDVLSRFQTFAQSFSLSHIIRISADSPLIHPDVVYKVLGRSSDIPFDISTNIFPRSFPKGQSVEVLTSETLDRMVNLPLLPTHREHVTSYIYENHQSFNISNHFNNENLSTMNMCVDIPEDLQRLEDMLERLDLSVSEGLPSWSEFIELVKRRTR